MKVFWVVAFLFFILFVYSVGAWADITNTVRARCTDGKSIKPCEVTTKGIIINNKYIDVEILDVIMVGNKLNILYREKK